VLKSPEDPDAAMAVMDDRGFVQAFVGSRDPGSVGTNLAINGHRPPGSSFKPVVLAQYLSEAGHTLDDKFPNPPSLPLPNEDPIFSVEGDATPEPIDLIQATEISSNTVFAQVTKEAGNKDTIALAASMGVRAESVKAGGDLLERAESSVRLGIGTRVEVSPLQMAVIYSTLANRGEKVGPYPIVKITTASGQSLWEAPTTRTRVIQQNVADQVNFALRQVLDSDRGTGHTEGRVNGQIVAGKTGTMALEDEVNRRNKENSDAWFIGFTCKLTTSVWLGRAAGNLPIGRVENVHPVNGGTLPARIFSKFMTQATSGLTSCPFERPAGSYSSTTMPSSTIDPTATSDRDPNDEPTTRRRPGFPFTFPSSTDPDDQTTTTRRGPGNTRGSTTTTTQLPGFPVPGGGNAFGLGPAP
jgi:penicillin-binding protein 1A